MRFRNRSTRLCLSDQGDRLRVKALAATAVAAVREIQALQAPHIAESDDAAMTRIEARMAAAERVARDQLKMLAEPCRARDPVRS